MYRIFVKYVLLLAFLPLAPLHAQISVSQSVLDFSAGQKTRDVEITNNGDYKVYLNMTVSEVVNPEVEPPKKVLLDDPRTAAVLVSPKQLLLAPGQRKRIRVIMREQATSKDKIYRLGVMPYTGKVNLQTDGDKKSSAIKVLVGYNLLVISRPQKENADVEVKRSGDILSFKNTGNTNVLLRKIRQCNSETDCVEMQPNRLYAGESYRVSLPSKSAPVEVWQSVGLENSRHNY